MKQNKIGTLLLKVPDSQLKPHLLMRVDSLKIGQISGRSCCDPSSNLHVSDTADSDGRWSHEQKQHQARAAREREVVTNETIKRSKHVQDAENADHTSANCPHFDKTCRNAEMSVIWRVRVDLLEHRSPRQREAARRARDARVQAQPKRVGIVVRMGTCRPSVPRRRSMRWKI